MEAFTTLSATAAPLEPMNVDTDQIIPARFLKSPRGDGYGQFLFHDLRMLGDGTERPDFFLNQPAYRNARILVANANFGCGSSREGAVYALMDYGYRCVVAPSFNDIFYSNSLRNGLLPVRLSAADVIMLRRLVTESPKTVLTVDLPSQTLTVPGKEPVSFIVDPFGKACLLQGADDISFTVGYRAQIEAFEARHSSEHPWLALRR